MATIGNLWINVKSNTKGLGKGLGKARGMLGKFGKFAASPAGIAVAAFAALTAGILLTVKALGSAVAEFMKFEAGMAEVKSILLDVTDSDFGRLEDSAKKLGATTAFTAEQASGGMANLARAGFSTNEILAATPAVLNLASATGMELAEASNIAAVAVRGFGLEATETAHVADVLALAASKTNTTVQEMGDAMSYVAPVANQLGFSIEETSAMLGKLADAGIKGSKGGTALRTIMLKLGSTIEKEGTGALKKYFQAQHSVTENMEKFGKIGVTAAGVLSGVVAETDELTTSMTEAVGVVDKMADARLDTLEGDVTLFQSAVSGLKTEIGEKLAPTLRAIVEVATKFIGGLQAAFESVFEGVEGSIISTETLMTVFKVMGGIIIGIVTVVGKVYNQIAFVVNSIKMLVYGLLAGISLQVGALVKTIAWGLDALGVISTKTYDDIVAVSNALTEELAEGAVESAKDAGENFMDGWAGGAEIAGAKAFGAFNDSMNGIGNDAGDELVEGMVVGVKDGMHLVVEALKELDPAIADLIEEATTMQESLKEQIWLFGNTAAEAIKYKLEMKGVTSATVENIISLERQLEVLKAEKKAQEDATKAIEQKAQALQTAAQSVIESLRTEEQVYNDEVSKLQEMFDAKLLTIEQFDMAVKRLKSGTEDDIEVNIVTKGVIEGLQSALGSIKVAGQVSKTEKLAEKQVEVQKKIEQVMTAVKVNTAKSATEGEQAGQHMHDMAVQLAGTMTTDVLGLETAVGSVVTSINGISTDEQTKEEVKNLGGINNSGFESVREAIRELGRSGAIEALT